MSETSIRKQALKEMAREKARVFDKESPSPGSLQEIPSRQEVKKNEPDIEEIASKEKMPTISPPFKEISLEESSYGQFNVHKIPASQEFPWKDYNPLGEPKKKQKVKTLNTVTIFLMAKKMINHEWKKAKGIKKRDHRLEQLEREAAAWKAIQEEDKREKEQAVMKFEKYKKDLEKLLHDISEKVVAQKDDMNLEKANKIVEDSFGNVGKVYDIDWKDKGLDVWIEPWEEKWARQKRGDKNPVIFYLRMNDRLGIDSINVVEDKDIIISRKKKMMERELESSIDKEEITGMDNEEISQLLEKKLNEKGRVVELRRLQDNRWIASIEPWDEIRQRNIKGTESAVPSTQIDINYLRGRFSFEPHSGK